jgi:hypothetical protein
MLDDTLQMPHTVTPFTVLALLRRIDGMRRLPEADKERLAVDMQRIESCHFGRADDPSLDLEQVARDWLRHAG